MSRDITLSYNANHELDISLMSGDLELSESLLNRILISLFTWAMPKADDVIPNGVESGGFWGDNVPVYPDDTPESVGSRMWLLDGKLTDDTIKSAISYAMESLQWMASDTDIAEYNVLAERGGVDRLDLTVAVTLTSGDARNIKFADILNWGK